MERVMIQGGLQFVCLFVCFKILFIYLRESGREGEIRKERREGEGEGLAKFALSAEPRGGTQSQDPDIMTLRS